MTANCTKDDTIRQGKGPHIKAGQGHLEAGKESQRQAKRGIRDSSPPTVSNSVINTKLRVMTYTQRT